LFSNVVRWIDGPQPWGRSPAKPRPQVVTCNGKSCAQSIHPNIELVEQLRHLNITCIGDHVSQNLQVCVPCVCVPHSRTFPLCFLLSIISYEAFPLFPHAQAEFKLCVSNAFDKDINPAPVNISCTSFTVLCLRPLKYALSGTDDEQDSFEVGVGRRKTLQVQHSFSHQENIKWVSDGTWIAGQLSFSDSIPCRVWRAFDPLSFGK
jgi:hypothetical protein